MHTPHLCNITLSNVLHFQFYFAEIFYKKWLLDVLILFKIKINLKPCGTYTFSSSHVNSLYSALFKLCTMIAHTHWRFAPPIMNRFDLLKKNPCVDEKVEDTKGVIRSHKSNTTDKTMAKGKGKKGQTIICKHYIEN